jgi:hypothetical protein
VPGQVVDGGNGVLWQQEPFSFVQQQVSKQESTMRSDETRARPTVRPVSLEPPPMPRRGLRLCEAVALGLLAAAMACGWIVTLTG